MASRLEFLLNSGLCRTLKCSESPYTMSKRNIFNGIRESRKTLTIFSAKFPSIVFSSSFDKFAQISHARFMSDSERFVKNEGSKNNEISPKISMDSFLDNIHFRGKLRSDSAAIYQAKETKKEFERQERQERRQNNQQRSISFSLFSGDQSTNQSNKQTRNQLGDQSTNQPFDDSLNKKLNADSVFTNFQQHDDAGTSPEIKEILSGASVLAAAGNVEGVRLCQKILAEHDEDTFNAEMHLNHQLANALWNNKEYNESVKLFKQIFYDYPLKRRKISNIFRFSILRAMKEYPCPEQMAPLRNFVDFCVTLRNSMPLTHLWQALFQHSVPGANEEAFELIFDFPELKNLVVFKLDSLLRVAREEQKSDVLFRMLSLLGILDLSEKDLRHLTGCIWDALMEIYCKNEDVEGAKYLIRIAKEQSQNGKADYLWPETVKKYVNLSGLTKVVLPNGVMTAKPVAPKLKF